MSTTNELSAAAFRRMVARLSSEQLRRLPLDRLPASIPLDAVDEHAEPDKYAALNELAWSLGVRDLSRRCEASDWLGRAECDALETAEAANTRGIADLDRLTGEVMTAWRAGEIEANAQSAVRQTLERARTRVAGFTQEAGTLHRAAAALENAVAPEPALQQRIDRARRHVLEVLRTLEAALGRHQLLEVDIAQADMRRRQRDCDYELRRYGELDDQIRAVEDKLRSPRRMMTRVITPRVARRQYEHLIERLDRLQRERDQMDVFVSEQDLLHWLDVLVDANLFVPGDQWRQRAQRTRLLLYRLLNIYCLQQEMAAQQVAVRALPGIDARQAIGYYLKSERFILTYFTRKRQEITLWLAGAACERLGKLDKVRDAILSDYRRYAGRSRTRNAAA